MVDLSSPMCSSATATPRSPDFSLQNWQSRRVTVGWEERPDGLYRRWEFMNFAEAWAFMGKVAVLAEAQDHHPDWSNSYNVVEITLCSHDTGRTVTNRDHRLAASINEIIDR